MHIDQISGTLSLGDGTEVQFTLDPTFGFQQWGAGNNRLWDSVELMERLADVVRDMHRDQMCEDCGECLNDDDYDESMVLYDAPVCPACSTTRDQ